MGRGGAAQSDLRAVNLKYARVAARGALARGDASSRQKSEFHESSRIVRGQIDAVQDGMVAFAQVNQGLMSVIATELQHAGGPGCFRATNFASLGHSTAHEVIITGY